MFIMSKIQIESNSQPNFSNLLLTQRCVYHVKDTNRKQFTTVLKRWKFRKWLCLSCQRYKSKAIHNYVRHGKDRKLAVFIMSKIQIESNSQQPETLINLSLGCVYHVKDTNRKQFTTVLCMQIIFYELCLSCQRYKSKAIHN